MSLRHCVAMVLKFEYFLFIKDKQYIVEKYFPFWLWSSQQKRSTELMPF